MKIPSQLPIKDASSIHKVLLVDLNFMGDMLMSSPVIRELKRNLGRPIGTIWCDPYVKVDVLCYDFCKPIVQMNKYVDRIYTTKWRFPLWQAIKARFRGYDLVLQLNTSLQTNLLLFVISKKRLGWSYRFCSIPLTVKIPTEHRTARSGNRIRENLDLLERAFGWKCEDEKMEIGK